MNYNGVLSFLGESVKAESIEVVLSENTATKLSEMDVIDFDMLSVKVIDGKFYAKVEFTVDIWEDAHEDKLKPIFKQAIQPAIDKGLNLEEFAIKVTATIEGGFETDVDYDQVTGGDIKTVYPEVSQCNIKAELIDFSSGDEKVADFSELGLDKSKVISLFADLEDDFIQLASNYVEKRIKPEMSEEKCSIEESSESTISGDIKAAKSALSSGLAAKIADFSGEDWGKFESDLEKLIDILHDVKLSISEIEESDAVAGEIESLLK